MRLVGLILGLLLQTRVPVEVEKAEETLAQKPDNQQANLIVGKYHLGQGDVEKAVPYLLKGSDSSLKAIAKSEEAAADLKGAKLVALGDEWLKLYPKGPLRQACVDRASYWYGKALPDLDTKAKLKLLDRLKILYAAPRGTRERMEHPKGWSGATDTVFEIVHTGSYAIRHICRPSRIPIRSKGAGVLDSLDFPAQSGKEYVLTFWVLTEGTESDEDRLTLDLVSRSRGIIAKAECKFPRDLPVWTKLTAAVTAPEDTMAEVRMTVSSEKGKVYLDDVSVKCDGKELLMNGGFEE